MQYVICRFIVAVILYHSNDRVSYSRLIGIVHGLSRTELDVSDVDRAVMLLEVYDECSKNLKRSLFLRKKWHKLTNKAYKLLFQETILKHLKQQNDRG